ncbi:MAG TPA: hypothetical protein VIL09_10305 [Microvirga sp.]
MGYERIYGIMDSPAGIAPPFRQPGSDGLKVVRLAPTPEELRAEAKPGWGRPYGQRTLEAIRHLVESTQLTFREIAARTGVSPATVTRRAQEHRWTRPLPAALPGTPAEEEPESTARRRRRGAMAERLMQEAERYLAASEARTAPNPMALRAALRLARAARVFDELERPRGKKRKRT